MLDRGVLYQANIENDPALPFKKIKERLKQADILFGNLESLISDQGINQGGAFSFRAPPKMMEGLLLADFNVLSLANNHSFDWTINALLDTKDRLEKEKVKTLILLGETADKIAALFADSKLEIIKVETMEAAAKIGAELLSRDKALLLSPACPSWDMYSSYKERGDIFKENILKNFD